MTTLRPKSNTPPLPRPDIVEVIDRAALIENLLNQIIVGYCRPPKEAWEFVWSVVLDTSVMSLGAKVKVVLAIAQEMHASVDTNALHSVISLRNAFAHHATHAHPVLVAGSKKGEKPTTYGELWVLTSAGKTERTPRHEALAEFSEKYATVRTSLVALAEKIHVKFGESAA